MKIPKKSVDKSVKPSTKKKESFSKQMKSLRGKVEIEKGFQNLVKDLPESEELSNHKFYSSLITNKVLVLLCPNKPLTISGAVDIQCLTGNVEIFGYQLEAGEKVSLFNPRGFNSFTINSFENGKKEEIRDDILNYFSQDDVKDCRRFLNPGTGLIVLSRHSSHKVDFVMKTMKENFFRSVHFLKTETPTYCCEYLLNCTIEETSSENIINVDRNWENVVLEKSSRLIVAGAQNVGKSTFVRYFLNSKLKFFSRILLIDLDIGQSEIFLPQTISATVLEKPLLGPGYLQNLNPLESIFIGEVNVLLSPEKYIKSVMELVKRCRENPELRGIPWIVNTMGYFKGFGLEILLMLYKIIHPTVVVQINDNQRNVQGNLFQSKVLEKMVGNLSDFPNFQLYQFEKNFYSMRYRKDAISAKDIRHLMVLCGLSGILKDGGGFINDIAPVSANTDNLFLYNSTTNSYSKDFSSVNGCLVYLCKKVESNSLSCFGVGVVRGYDHSTKKIYLLHSCSTELLSEVNCLALGSIVLPSSLLTNQGPKINRIPNFLYRTKDFSGSKSIKQMHHKIPTRNGHRHKG